MKINWHGVAAALVSIFGIASSPAVLGILPPKTATIIAGLGVVYQAMTKPAAQPPQ